MNQAQKASYEAGKLAHVYGVPELAIDHVRGEPKTFWLAGWHDMRAELVRVRSQANRNRRSVLSESRLAVLQ
jgi:hypothetical protein